MTRHLPFLLWGFLTLVLLGASGFFLLREQSFRARSIEVEATVVGTRETLDSAKGERVYSADFEYLDARGTKHTYSTSSGSSYVKGEKQTIRIDPEHPEDHRGDGGLFAGIVLGFIGLVFGGILVKVLGSGGAGPERPERRASTSRRR